MARLLVRRFDLTQGVLDRVLVIGSHGAEEDSQLRVRAGACGDAQPRLSLLVERGTERDLMPA
jgi:hypothetical protein